MGKRKKLGRIILAAVLMCSALALPEVYAADPVDLQAECSLKINCTSQFEKTGALMSSALIEVYSLPVEIDLYKVAEIDVTGKYTSTDGFSGMDFSGINHSTATSDWMKFAADAKKIVDTAREDVIPVETKATKEGTTTFEKLPVGLYLVDAQQLLSPHNQYDFTPYLVSLPNNYYSQSNQDDTWIYDAVVGLKPEKSDRYGDLKIVKTLSNYNATVDGATFVFQVEATKTDVDTKETTVVYSNVVAIDFNEPGQKEVLIQNIPAGANVKITEIYTGASYELVSDATKTAMIVANEAEGAPVTVNFENTYSGNLNGGNGIVNSFIYSQDANGNSTWTHSAMSDSTGIQPRQQQ